MDAIPLWHRSGDTAHVHPYPYANAYTDTE